MDSQPLGYLAAVSATVQHVNSARPDAPVVPDRRFPRPRRPHFTIVPARDAAARRLHRLADAVAPRCAPNCAPPAPAR